MSLRALRSWAVGIALLWLLVYALSVVYEPEHIHIHFKADDKWKLASSTTTL